MQISDKGINLIKEFEGFRAQPYICPAGKNTVAYGHVIRPDDNLTYPLSENDATELLATDIDSRYGPSVLQMVDGEMTQGQFDALCSFAYNCGVNALLGSTLMRKFNAGDTIGASKEFGKWNKVNGKPFDGLTRRREAERKLFMGEL